LRFGGQGRHLDPTRNTPSVIIGEVDFNPKSKTESETNNNTYMLLTYTDINSFGLHRTYSKVV